MKAKKVEILTVTTVSVLILILSCWFCFKPLTDFSKSERRVLAKPPKSDFTEVLNGEFSSDFESYTQDQFPLRDRFKALKAFTVYKIFGNIENNSVFKSQGHLSKVDKYKNSKMIDHAVNSFKNIYDTYLQGVNSNIYISVIPDKNCFLAETENLLSYDFEEFANEVYKKTDFAKPIDLKPFLSLDSYYKTDSHWRQEKLIEVADFLLSSMNSEKTVKFNQKSFSKEFHGVYSGQYLLKTKPDEIKYLTNEYIESSKLVSLETLKPVEKDIYDFKKIEGYDLYEFFMGGLDALQILKSEKSLSDKKLIIFRDSFASSLVPLLAQSYSEIVLVDTRYIEPKLLKDLVNFKNSDILFLYSSTILNNSLALKG